MIYTLDTSVVIDAVRQPESMAQLKQFLEWALPYTALTSVVVSELLRGARTKEARAFLEAQIVGPFQRRCRIVAPSVAAWTRTGDDQRLLVVVNFVGEPRRIDVRALGGGRWAARIGSHREPAAVGADGILELRADEAVILEAADA